MPGPDKTDPDLVSLISKAGKGFGNIFKSKRDPKAEKPSEPSAAKSSSMDVPILKPPDHGFSFGHVYANAVAAGEFYKASPNFQVGSIVVRERMDSPTSKTPTVVIAMIKREAGFSKDTGDWEFLVLKSIDFKPQSRETVGRCAECHTNARETDWVFIKQLNK